MEREHIDGAILNVTTKAFLRIAVEMGLSNHRRIMENNSRYSTDRYAAQKWDTGFLPNLIILRR